MSEFLDRAVQSHVNWKLKLLTVISEGSQIDMSAICPDDQCELGRWIYSEGQTFKELAEFRALHASHQEFHKCACEVAELITAGRHQDAKSEVTAGAYKRASVQTVDSIHKLKALRVVA